MAFDAGFLAAVAAELKKTALGGRIERVTQPERDTVVLQMRTFEGGKRLLVNAGSSNPRIGFTDATLENPQNPPLFCTLLRKHLSGARLADVRQIAESRPALPFTDTPRIKAAGKAISERNATIGSLPKRNAIRYAAGITAGTALTASCEQGSQHQNGQQQRNNLFHS